MVRLRSPYVSALLLGAFFVASGVMTCQWLAQLTLEAGRALSGLMSEYRDQAELDVQVQATRDKEAQRRNTIRALIAGHASLWETARRMRELDLARFGAEPPFLGTFPGATSGERYCRAIIIYACNEEMPFDSEHSPVRARLERELQQLLDRNEGISLEGTSPYVPSSDPRSYSAFPIASNARVWYIHGRLEPCLAPVREVGSCPLAKPHPDHRRQTAGISCSRPPASRPD